MKVRTVLGDIDAKDLGITLPHEHLILNAWGKILTKNPPPDFKEVIKSDLFNQKITMSNLGELKINCTAILDNLILSAPDLAIEEIMKFKEYGGNTIVDLTNENIEKNKK